METISAMNVPDCELSILVARPDTSFMNQTVRHLVRACNYPFKRKVITADTAPLGGAYRTRTDLAPMSAFHERCDQLIADRVMDEKMTINYDEEFQRQVYIKHFGSAFEMTHDHRSCPILGTLSYIEQATSPYMVHFDSDMLLYQHLEFNWIKRGIELMQSDERIICVLPRSGPPSMDGTMHQLVDYIHNPEGFFEFKYFTSRVFLIDVQRFQALLPLTPQFLKQAPAPARRFTGEIKIMITAMVEPKFEPWESMVTARIKDDCYVRADLDDCRAWTLHAVDHGPDFIAKLPGIIQNVESGIYPSEQAGHYDLDLSCWD